MGNTSSNEEKFLHSKNGNSQRKAWINGQFGNLLRPTEDLLTGRAPDNNLLPTYHHLGRKDNHKYQNKRNFSFYHRNGKGKILKSKSHSLDAIIEELYLSGGEDNSIYDTGSEFSYEPTRSLIPRIKLTRSVSSLRDERRYHQLFDMSANPEILHVVNSEESTRNIRLRNEEEEDKTPERTAIYVNNNNDYDEISKKPDENYFAKNFDECIKRLQLIEKEHEMIEKDDANIQFYFLQKQPESRQMEISGDKISPPQAQIFVCETESDKEKEKPESECEKLKQKSSENGEVYLNEDFVAHQRDSDMERETIDLISKENQEPISDWYSNLKQQFEKPLGENEEQKSKEMTCRITGATLKNSCEIQKPENKEKDTRHYFSRLVKSNKSLIDEELPDPDKVKNIRAMFQENLNSTLKRKLNKKLGGSLQNISVKANEQMERPLSAQCNREELMGEMQEKQKIGENKESKVPETPDLKDSEKEFQIEITKRKLFEKYEKELKLGRDFRGKKLLQSKWTDTGSVSSGISSDLSSYDTDLECYSREGIEHEPDDVTISDDDLLEEVKDKHYVQNEILDKIRSFGTSVTYYGGEMITCSVGPILSPTTQAIMEEIGGKLGQEPRTMRSFNEFYRKYAETIEPARKKKLGRTRSFGQNDFFQKPLNNTEIEMYKNDLEFEIGIKKPTGIPQKGLKPRLTKSMSLESGPEVKIFQTPTIKIDAVTDSDVAQETKIDDEEEEIKQTEKSDVTENNQDEKMNFCETETSEKNIETQVLENKNTEEVTSEQKYERKEPMLFRSKSAPEELHETYETNIEIESEELPSKEILFGYEKSLINSKRNSDMEFEEFEVCETLSEKLDKLQEINSSSLINSQTNETEIVDANGEAFPKEKAVEIIQRNSNINLNEDNETESNKSFKTDQEEMINMPKENSKEISNPTWDSQISNFINQSDRKYGKQNHSRWPIETTVMVDIQKNNEQTPKLVTNGKTVAKTKIRLF